jgi:1L-myo-inositol 1-phosphate cytidylyltransferase / CDP-L-myo-inositol myo-inositolphosphotransferase
MTQTIIGLLSIAHPRADLPGVAKSTLVAGGISLLECNVRLLRHAGAGKVFVLADLLSPAMTETIDRLRAAGSIELLRSALDLAGLLESSDHVVMIEEGLLLDERLVQQFVATRENAVAVWPVGTAQGTKAVRMDSSFAFGSILSCQGEIVRTVAKGLGDWDLEQTLLRAVAGHEGTEFVDLSGFDTYAPNRRRDVQLIWQPMAARPDEETAMDLLLDSAQKGCLDWPARFIHPPVENMAVRLLAATPITPNQITLLTGLVGFAATFAFAKGLLWLGLLLALITGPLDGVDGKLARTRVEYSKYGDLEHVLDKIVEYSWYMALAYAFRHTHGVTGPWAIAAIIIIMAFAEAIQGEFFRRFTGTQLDDYGDTERKIRLFAGRRNTFFWTLVLFAFLDRWYLGFAMIALYATGTFFVAQWRFFKRMQEFGTANSAAVTANFKASEYGFLSRPKPSSND